ncbi:MarR family transcriptional regulator [Polynucleobacter sp. P1-05-14]|uniref:MarR family transcriptional regulator n=1 Tax=Polynucleobacter sp. P1-05-14 TaxID=1819732 RepID=UPI001C0AE041|nr:MarR family transcriptional regulator [Polynucleobacter sp. P1-05-14]MBU3548045.1 MarR family transcriptional regulator [Polynucleobacter sp. P1-05-14]
MKKALGSDFAWQDWRVNVKSGIFTVRDLRSILLSYAYALKLEPEKRYLCILTESKLTSARLESELQEFKQVVSSPIAEKIFLALHDQGKGFISFPEFGCDIPQKDLKQFIQEQTALSRKRLPGTNRSTVLNLLILQWLHQGEPQTTESLCQASGASYPTVFNTIKRLEAEGLMIRESDRRVSLKRFPENLWKRWTIDGGERGSIRFRDMSGQPRTTEDLVERFKKLALENVAIGGVIGANYYYPKLDITGSPYLDLVVHGSANSSLEFIQKIDPALHQVNSLIEPADVVVHFLSRTKPFFSRDPEGLLLADPIECMANLYDGGLDYQANDMLTALIANHDQR